MVGTAGVSLGDRESDGGDASAFILSSRLWGGRTHPGLADASLVFVDRVGNTSVRYCWSVSAYYCWRALRWQVATRLTEVGEFGFDSAWDLFYDEEFDLSAFLTTVNGTRADWGRFNRYGWHNQRVLRSLLVRYDSELGEQERPFGWTDLPREVRQQLREILDSCPVISGPTQFLWTHYRTG